MKVFFATGNAHKVSEANVFGKGRGVRFAQVDCPYPEKRSDSVSEVAREGASLVYDKLKKPVIVEDSGLFIQALDDFPGAYSALVYGKIGNFGILRLLEGAGDRRACFKSALAFSDGKRVRVFEGVVEGRISFDCRGEAGFGYDPIFMPAGFDKTFAEDPKIKADVSHRKKSVEAFIDWITKRSH